MAYTLGCDLKITDILEVLDPIQAANFLNPSFFDNLDLDKGGYTIKIFYNGVAYDFSKYYKPGTMYIEDIFGFEVGIFRFELWDFERSFNWAFMPIGNQYVEVWNYNETELLARGRLQDGRPMHRSPRFDNSGQDKKVVEFTCSDLKVDFKRWLFSESYSNVTTYGLMRDVIKRFTPFDHTEIDSSKGLTITEYKVSMKYAADVLQEMLDLEVTSTFYLDRETNKVYIDEKDSLGMSIIEVNEENKYEIFDIRDFFINRQNQILRNRVHFWFNGLYTSGTINVSNGSKDVIGVGTKFLNYVKPGATLKKKGATATYNVEDVLSNTSLRISSQYAEATQSGMLFSLSGFRDYVTIDDSENIATMALVLGESFQRAGVFEVKIPERANGMTREQAYLYAQSYLNRLVNNPILRGQSTARNYKFNKKNMRAGMVVAFNLPLSRGLSIHAVVQKLIREDAEGGLLDRTISGKSYYDGERIEAIHQVTFEYTDRRLYQDQVLEKILQDQRDVKITDDEIVEMVRKITEPMLMGDCASIIEGFGPIGDKEEKITVQDSAFITVVDPSLTYYTQPVTGDHLPAYTLGENHYSFTS